MENKKIPLIMRIYSAIADFRIYPLIQKEKFGTAIGYFLKLILLISLVYALSITDGLYNSLSKIAEDYNTQIPDFIIENGECVADKATYTTGSELIIFDTDYKVEQLADLYSKELIGYNSYALVGSNAIDVYANKQIGYRIEFENIPETITKELVYNYAFKNVRSANFEISLFIIVFISAFTVLIQFKIMSLFVTVLLAYMLNIIFGVTLKFKDALKISMYVLTLPVLIELIAFLTVGSISESVSFIYQFLMAIYVFYALRAIKLDKMLLEATKNGILKKVVKSDGTKEDITFTINMESDNEKSKEEPVNKDENKNEENKED